MRWLLVTLLLLSLGATYPRHRRFMQKTLPARAGASCIPVSGTVTNYALWSQAMDPGGAGGATWEVVAVGAATPTITAGQAVTTPSCASTNNIVGCNSTGLAIRAQFPATALTQWTTLRQAGIAAGGGNKSGSVYVKGVSGSGTLEICTSTAVDFWCTSTAFNASTWVLLKDDDGGAAATFVLYIGNLGVDSRPDDDFGHQTRSAADVYLWQADAQAPSADYRPVKTTTTAVTQGPGCY